MIHKLADVLLNLHDYLSLNKVIKTGLKLNQHSGKLKILQLYIQNNNQYFFFLSEVLKFQKFTDFCLFFLEE